jgi:hypothetical protein
VFSRSIAPRLPNSEELYSDGRISSKILLHPKGFSFLSHNETAEASQHIASEVVLFHGNEFSLTEPKKKHQAEYKKNLHLSKAIFQAIGLPISEAGEKPLRRHSDVVFLPISASASPLYIHPWVSTSDPVSGPFPKIKEFVMTNCLFGGSILGIDEQENRYPLIDHKLHVSDMITRIVVDESIHPYEAMSFAALEGLFPVMAQSGRDFIIRYHLPVIDYMLYGIHLYISGKIAFGALEDFVEQVKIRGQKHRTIVQALAEKSGIVIKIESPFDNLFAEGAEISANSLLSQLSLSVAQVERMKSEHPVLAEKLRRAARRGGHKVADFKSVIDIFNAWDEVSSSISPVMVDTASKEQTVQKTPRELFEELCIENILDHLTKNTQFLEYSQVWQEIVAGGEVTRFSPLQQLFKVANVAFIARSCIGRASFEVCSLLPIDEKPIAQSYKEFLAEKFGHILCLSWFPPLLSYINYEGSSAQRANHLNNLFRFRPDKSSIDMSLIKGALTTHFGLTFEFWKIINASFSSDEEISEILSSDKASSEAVQTTEFLKKGVVSSPVRNCGAMWESLKNKAPAITRSQSLPIF